MKWKYGKCDLCNSDLLPKWFLEIDEETGKQRRAVDFLYCPCCLEHYTVDDSFDGEWF